MAPTAADPPWPDLHHPDLIERLRLDDQSFHDLWVGLARQMPPRPFTEEAFATGTGYPWPRPAGSFVLDQGEGRPLADLDPSRRQALLTEFTGPGSDRIPMLAIGSNGSPEGLWRKFAHFEDPADRTLLAIDGRLVDFDVGPAAELALYGAMPATLFPSPGTKVRTSLVWLTDNQLTQLAWAEIPYWIGKLETAFEPETIVTELGFGGFERNLVFINRFGVFAPEGSPLSLAAITAENRTARETTQVELLEILAEVVFDDRLNARDVVRMAFEQPGEVGPVVADTLRSNSIRFESDRWVPFQG